MIPFAFDVPKASASANASDFFLEVCTGNTGLFHDPFRILCTQSLRIRYRVCPAFFICLLLQASLQRMQINNASQLSLQGVCSPYGIRTRITTVKGWCPSP